MLIQWSKGWGRFAALGFGLLVPVARPEVVQKAKPAAVESKAAAVAAVAAVAVACLVFACVCLASTTFLAPVLLPPHQMCCQLRCCEFGQCCLLELRRMARMQLLVVTLLQHLLAAASFGQSLHPLLAAVVAAAAAFLEQCSCLSLTP